MIACSGHLFGDGDGIIVVLSTNLVQKVTMETGGVEPESRFGLYCTLEEPLKGLGKEASEMHWFPYVPLRSVLQQCSLCSNDMPICRRLRTQQCMLSLQKAFPLNNLFNPELLADFLPLMSPSHLGKCLTNCNECKGDGTILLWVAYRIMKYIQLQGKWPCLNDLLCLDALQQF